MPLTTVLVHSPQNVLRELIILLGKGTDPDAVPLGAWPVYDDREPSEPDNCITCYGTLGIDHGRDAVVNERNEWPGFQVRVRSTFSPIGWTRAHAIAMALDQVVMRQVIVEEVTYLVRTVVRTGNVLPLGSTDIASKRSIHVFNGLLVIQAYA